MTNLLDQMDSGDMTAVDTIVKGKAAVAAHFGKSERQVRRWVKDPSFPRLSGGRFDLLQVQTWLDRRQGMEVKQGMEVAPGEERQPALTQESGKDFWDKEGKKFQAKQRELDYRVRLGDLVERKEVEEMFVSRILACKQGLLSLARGLPPQLIHCQGEREMEVVISQAVRRLLEEFSRPLPQNLGSGVSSPASDLAEGVEN